MNRKLLRSVREYKRETILTPVFVALEVLMEVLIPLLMAKIIDVGIMDGDIGYIVKMGIILVVLAIVSLFSVPRRDNWEPSPQPDMPRICGMISSIRSRIFPLEILTIFPRQVW